MSMLPVLALLIISCEKSKDENKADAAIKIGEYENMLVDSNKNIIESSYNHYQDIQLDVNHDQYPDVRLVVMEIGSPGMGIHYVSEIQPLTAAFELYGQYTIDTSFLQEQVSYSIDSNYVYQTSYYKHCCFRTLNSDRVESIMSAFHPLELAYHQTLSNTGTFSSDTISFIYSWSSPIISYFENDTAFVHQSTNLFNCHAIPYGTDVYLGFRFTDDQIHLGWLKLKLEAESRMQLKEWAIQR